MADHNYNRPYRTNDPNRRPSAQAPSNASSNDPLAELARLIGQNDPFAEFNPPGSRSHQDARAPASNAADWQQSGDPAHDDFFRRPAAHSSHADDRFADDEAPETQSAPSSRYLTGQGYYDRDPGYSDQNHPHDVDPQQRADSYTDYHNPAQPDYEQSGYDQPSYDRDGSNPAGYAGGGPHGGQGLPPNAPYAQPESRSRSDAYSQGYAQNDGYAEHDAYPGEHGREPDDRYDDPPARRGGLLTVVAVLGLAIVGTAGAFTYRATFGKGGSVPVFKRESGPTKLAIAQSDPQSSKPAIERVERIVPREEPPVDVQQTIVPDPPPAMPNVRPATPSAPPPPSIGFAPSPPPAAGAPAAPRRVHIVPIKPSDADPSVGSANPSPRAGPSRSSNAPLSLANVAQGRAVAPANPSATRAPSGSAGAEGAFLVQVSSQRSEPDAQASFRSLKAKYPDVLGDREPVVRRADLGDKGIYYRAMVGGFATAQEAGQFCDSLKAAGGACLIQKN